MLEIEKKVYTSKMRLIRENKGILHMFLTRLGQKLDHQPQEDIKKRLGSKSFHLHQLKSLQLTVPDGFCIHDYQDIEYLLNNMPKIMSAIESIGGLPVAIRSSSCNEDLVHASFAGLYESVLNVKDVDGVVSALRKVDLSKNSDRVKNYLLKKKIKSKGDNSFSILVQKMIPAKQSGVFFGIDPISGKEEHGVIECVDGTGDNLVSGRMTPTRLIVDLFEKSIIKKEESPESFIELNKEVISKIIEIGQGLKSFYKTPQDIEWCIDESNRLYILQTRAITKVQWREDLGQMSDADLKDGGVSARVCTPMMYSLYNINFQRSMDRYTQKIKLHNPHKRTVKWMEYVYGRVYWNAGEVKKILMQLPGYDEKEFDQDLGVVKDYGSEGPQKFKIKIRAIPKLVQAYFSVLKEFKDVRNEVEKYLFTFDSKDQLWKDKLPKLAKVPDKVFYSDFHQMINDYYIRTESLYFRLIYNSENYQTEFKSLVGKINKVLDSPVNLIKILGGLGQLSHLEIQRDLLSLVSKKTSTCDWESEKQQFMSKHYHHSDVELDLTVPRWGEVPGKVDDLLKLVESLETDFLIKVEKKQQDLSKGEIRRVENELKRKNSFIYKYQIKKWKSNCSWLRWYLLNREKMRECSTRTYYVVRHYLLEFGQRMCCKRILTNQSDIFMFKIEELLKYCEEPYLNYIVSKDLIKFRKEQYEGHECFDTPHEFGPQVNQLIQDDIDGEFSGLACSNGIIEGPARVITDLSQVHEVQRGEILVTHYTDPAWTPVLGLVAGVVTEVGGLLSHAAVIGREYGIPAILNIPLITQKIKTGQILRINGHSGQIHVLS